MTLTLLLGMLILDWKDRVHPYRAERISIGQSILAGLLGLILGSIFTEDEGVLLVATGLAGVSLIVNAFSPGGMSMPARRPY